MNIVSFTSRDGTHVACHVTGRGDPLVLVHGTTADHARWMPLVSSLEQRFTVYALDRFLPVVHTFGDFVPAGPEGLYQELIEASRHGHVLASASIAGFFSAANSK